MAKKDADTTAKKDESEGVTIENCIERIDRLEAAIKLLLSKPEKISVDPDHAAECAQFLDS